MTVLHASPRRDGVTALGEQLRAERERHGKGLDQVSEATKIQKAYLEALEGQDWNALPADVFTRGYIRSYADYLGLDQEHLLRVYARQRRIAGEDDASKSERAHRDEARAILKRLAETHGGGRRRIGTKTKWIALALSGSGVAALAAWAFLPSTAVEVPPQAERKVVAATPPPAPPLVLPVEPPAPAEPSRASHMTVGDFGVGTGIVAHELVGRRDQFREGSVAWFWTSVLGGGPGDKIRHVWLHGGKPVAVAELHVNGTPWRTQSRRPLPKGSIGDWTVELRDPEDHVIATAGFTCVAAE